MITGFNTDIEHNGTVYHVQTEDKGLDTPIILSLVYVGGTILASKRSPYTDLIDQGFSDEVLAERLKRQHKLICAAINSGRIDDLKKMSRAGSAKGSAAATVQETVATVSESVSEEEEPSVVETAPLVEEALVEEVLIEDEAAPALSKEFGPEFEFEYGPITQEWSPPPPRVEEPVEEVVEEEESAPEPEMIAEDAAETFEEAPQEGLSIVLLDDEEFYSGEKYTLRVLISNRTGEQEVPLQNVAVSIKILGTTFRPLIYSLKTERDGVATVATQIPEFNSGRAAVLVRAATKDQAAELRRIIHPAK
ncbi:MAG TPA: hypothetical protein VJP89_16920 [Pyrinomonadaceae bacterium]|nr:hypothetical protein [Pyrinomonadaceae bacterium]